MVLEPDTLVDAHPGTEPESDFHAPADANSTVEAGLMAATV
jgi:hypothetical protein